MRKSVAYILVLLIFFFTALPFVYAEGESLRLAYNQYVTIGNFYYLQGNISLSDPDLEESAAYDFDRFGMAVDPVFISDDVLNLDIFYNPTEGVTAFGKGMNAVTDFYLTQGVDSGSPTDWNILNTLQRGDRSSYGASLVVVDGEPLMIPSLKRFSSDYKNESFPAVGYALYDSVTNETAVIRAAAPILYAGSRKCTYYYDSNYKNAYFVLDMSDPNGLYDVRMFLTNAVDNRLYAPVYSNADSNMRGYFFGLMSPRGSFLTGSSAFDYSGLTSVFGVSADEVKAIFKGASGVSEDMWESLGSYDYHYDATKMRPGWHTDMEVICMYLNARVSDPERYQFIPYYNIPVNENGVGMYMTMDSFATLKPFLSGYREGGYSSADPDRVVFANGYTVEIPTAWIAGYSGEYWANNTTRSALKAGRLVPLSSTYISDPDGKITNLGFAQFGISSMNNKISTVLVDVGEDGILTKDDTVVCDTDGNPIGDTIGDFVSDGGFNAERTGITRKFPFSLPFDLIDIYKTLVAVPEAPRFVHSFNWFGFKFDIDIDLSRFDAVAKICRTFISAIAVCSVIYMSAREFGFLKGSE
jgi:hypothetical protein